MNREIFRLAIPNMISHITVPLMGIFSTSIAGHLGDGAHTIGALAVGVSIFNFIYWNCSFVRMSTSGFTAQAFGAGRFDETTAMLLRAVAVSLFLGLFVLLAQFPLGEFALWLMNGDDLVAQYFYARVWAVPAGIMLFGLNGWFTGMQNAVIPMITAIVVNVMHVACSLWFVFGCDMGIAGIAYAAVVAQWSGFILSVILLVAKFRHTLRRVKIAEVLDIEPMREFFRANADIMIRTFCIVIVYTFFTAASSRLGDTVLLAVNSMLMQLFTLFSYMNDGFAYAAEALTGRFIGARNRESLYKAVRYSLVWTFCIAIFCVAIYVGWWRDILDLFIDDNGLQREQLFAAAERYVGWVIAIPLVSAFPFLIDGVMVGATLTRTMRDTMLLATAAHFAIYFATRPFLGNDAIWLAFTFYIAMRGVLQYAMSAQIRSFVRGR